MFRREKWLAVREARRSHARPARSRKASNHGAAQLAIPLGRRPHSACCMRLASVRVEDGVHTQVAHATPGSASEPPVAEAGARTEQAESFMMNVFDMFSILHSQSRARPWEKTFSDHCRKEVGQPPQAGPQDMTPHQPSMFRRFTLASASSTTIPAAAASLLLH